MGPSHQDVLQGHLVGDLTKLPASPRPPRPPLPPLAKAVGSKDCNLKIQGDGAVMESVEFLVLTDLGSVDICAFREVSCSRCGTLGGGRSEANHCV